MPDTLAAQLGPAGRMVIPVNGELLLVVRDQGVDELVVSRHGYYRFVPLR